MIITHRIQALLIESKKPLTARQIADELDITSNDASRFLSSLRRKLGAQLIKRELEGKMHYAIGEQKFEAIRKRIFTLPPDLNRGWRNPETGYQPDRLGV